MQLRILVGAVLALNAYLLSKAVAALTRREAPILLAPRSRQPRPVAAERTPSAMAILRRNPFDSITGPLDVEPVDVENFAVVPSDPLRAPSCEGIAVLSTAEFPDPRASTATLRAASEKRGMIRRLGDHIGDGVVAFIGSNPLTSSPSVWIERRGALCQARLFQAASASPSTPPPSVPAMESGTPANELFAGIRRLSPTLVQVDRQVIAALVREYPKYTRGLRVRAAKRQGNVIGLQLRRIRSSNLLARLGFRSRDRIESVNGYPVTSAEEARAVLARSKSASQIRVQLTRNQQPVVIELAVR